MSDQMTVCPECRTCRDLYVDLPTRHRVKPDGVALDETFYAYFGEKDEAWCIECGWKGTAGQLIDVDYDENLGPEEED